MSFATETSMDTSCRKTVLTAALAAIGRNGTVAVSAGLA